MQLVVLELLKQSAGLAEIRLKVLPDLFQIIGSSLVSISLEPAGPVKDITLDTWLVHRNACSNLCNLLQQ